MSDIEVIVNENEPKANFFLFPPIEPAGDLSFVDATRKLRLDEVGDTRDFVIFLALPYCRVRCHSCHCFKHILPGRADTDAILDHYVAGLVAQIRKFGECRRLSAKRCGAIYFGGGTASLLRPDDMELLLRTLRDSFSLRDGLEITLEGSPLEFSADYLRAMHDLGINRLSIGFQSRFDELLEVLNSPHRAQAGIAAIDAAMAIGFEQVNVDLLYNIPRQTREQWEADVDALLAAGIGSISMGDYMIFPDSPAEKLIRRGRNPHQLPQADVYDWFEWAVDRLAAAGYHEQVRGIFPKQGKQHDYVEISCVQNSDIVGIGAGAYTFLSGYQLRNIMNVNGYVEEMLAGNFLAFDSISRKSSDRDLRIRFIMHNFFSSRLRLDDYVDRFGTDVREEFAPQIRQLEQRGLLMTADAHLELTREGRMLRKHVYQEFYQAA